MFQLWTERKTAVILQLEEKHLLATSRELWAVLDCVIEMMRIHLSRLVVEIVITRIHENVTIVKHEAQGSVSDVWRISIELLELLLTTAQHWATHDTECFQLVAIINELLLEDPDYSVKIAEGRPNEDIWRSLKASSGRRVSKLIGRLIAWTAAAGGVLLLRLGGFSPRGNAEKTSPTGTARRLRRRGHVKWHSYRDRDLR